MGSHFETMLGCLVRALLASTPDRTSLARSTLSMAQCFALMSSLSLAIQVRRAPALYAQPLASRS